ncbi:MAG: glutamate formimidoyltransferase [Deltaproteobacteria bacterium]|nr:glutamate formimidoyltransferase [Deltaproteobacteria bacterium]
MKLLECVPNFSEGKNKEVVERIAAAAASVEGVRLLDRSMDPDHHRSVITFIGPPEAVLAGAMNACGTALSLIDMKTHIGCHPRIGAVDVVPFVALKGTDMADAVSIAHRFGRLFAETHNVPVYFYGEAALLPERRDLPALRRGGYECLEERLGEACWAPDAGPSCFNERCGATAVGARKILVAFNVNLKTGNLKAAKEIASRIREAGGGLRDLRAIGVPLASRGIVQVSMNLVDYEVTSMKAAFDAVSEEASRRGIAILESELIGLIPKAALKDTTPEYLKLAGFGPAKILENHL